MTSPFSERVNVPETDLEVTITLEKDQLTICLLYTSDAADE